MLKRIKNLINGYITLNGVNYLSYTRADKIEKFIYFWIVFNIILIYFNIIKWLLIINMIGFLLLIIFKR